MKKILGILGICSVIASSAFIAGCGNKDEGAPPPDDKTPPADMSKPASKSNPGTVQTPPPPPPVTK